MMVESIAIMEYLAARYGPTDLLPIASAAAFPLYQQFLHLGEAGMSTCLNIVVASRYFAPGADRDNWGARQALQMFRNRLTLCRGAWKRFLILRAKLSPLPTYRCVTPWNWVLPWALARSTAQP